MHLYSKPCYTHFDDYCNYWIAAYSSFLNIATFFYKLFKNKMTLGEISAVEELMRMAVTGQQHVDGLIGYYRSNIDSYNN